MNKIVFSIGVAVSFFMFFMCLSGCCTDSLKVGDCAYVRNATDVIVVAVGKYTYLVAPTYNKKDFYVISKETGQFELRDCELVFRANASGSKGRAK